MFFYEITADYKMNEEAVTACNEEAAVDGAKEAGETGKKGAARAGARDNFNRVRELERKMRKATAAIFDGKCKDKAIIFSGIRGPKMIFRACYRDKCTDMAEDLRLICDEGDVEISNLQVNESTYGSFNRELVKTLDLEWIDERRLRSEMELPPRMLGLWEEIIDSKRNKKEIYSAAEKILADKNLIEELDRIYLKGRAHKNICHPVHYMLSHQDSEALNEMRDILLEALQNNDRLDNKRCYTIRIDEELDPTSLGDRYRLARGGVVVVIMKEEDEEENEYVDSLRWPLLMVCENAVKYKHEVLTVFMIQSIKKDKKQFLYDNLHGMTFVEMQGDLAYDDRARNFLKSYVDRYGVKADKKLYLSVRENTGYTFEELKKIADEWYERKIKSYVYPQYQNVASINEKCLKSKHKGAAIEEVNRMIGLKSAKEVLGNALNYYKVQKMYEHFGVRNDRPAMHMIFTGNPGTAKTTMARLFARVMCDNSLLSSGHLVEVGRADLIGKYVGWTAPLIKKKFAEARGGVLFIDEAYSLVDDRDGSFGDEAINTIVQEMENNRGDVIVIFAGYPDKMEGFIRKNPGLRSRIAFHVNFDDYSPAELMEISDLMAEQNGVKLTAEAKNSLMNVYEKVTGQKDFGNGRFVRNMIEQAKMKQASRIVNMDFNLVDKTVLTTITEEDIVEPALKTEEKRKIGFM